uniref:MFS transporter n=1 Tax=Nonomuraea lactucae TaxID=2249762 RepID=UPI001963DAB8
MRNDMNDMNEMARTAVLDGMARAPARGQVAPAPAPVPVLVLDRVGGVPVPDRAVRAPVARGRYGWLPVAALGAGAFAIGTDMFVVAGILGGIARDLGVTAGAAGVTVTVFALAYASGAVLLGAVLGARPPRQVLIGSMAAFAVLGVLSAAAPALPALLVARVLGALAASAYMPAAGA